ncbi:MAG: hypothetical protein ACREIT_01505 [Tepidisphaeraceae bacterium]
MPQMVNGCGTWYYGKKNLIQYQGTCRACGAVTTLTSYDTRLYVVIILIPVIPLGRKRIVEECASCQRHFAVPLKDWQRAQQRTEEMIAAYRAKPAVVNNRRWKPPADHPWNRGPGGPGRSACKSRSGWAWAGLARGEEEQGRVTLLLTLTG